MRVGVDDLCIRASLTCLQLLALVRGGHGCLALLCRTLLGAGGRCPAISQGTGISLCPVCFVRLMLVVLWGRAQGSGTWFDKEQTA